MNLTQGEYNFTKMSQVTQHQRNPRSFHTNIGLWWVPIPYDLNILNPRRVADENTPINGAITGYNIIIL